jgi:glycosyltransferase involved in cell wall biosynthesis
VYNGVDTGRFAARIKEYEPAAPVVGTCGQFAPHKGWPDFLSAIRICREEFPGLKCLIVGDGPMREEIVSMAETMGLTGAVEFAGYRKDVRPFLGRMDIFMMASLSEGLPVAVIEAMASGLPVVATDVGGVSELVAHGETGLVSEAGNPQRLALHASMLLRDGRLMERFGGAGRRRVCESFTIQKMVAGYEELYRKV